MARPDDDDSSRLSRLGSFTDGVFAIVLTLPVVQLATPTVTQGVDLATAYHDAVPGLVAYLLGFVAVGLLWTHSHFGSHILKKTDYGYDVLTLLFLASVSLMSFPVEPFVRNWGDPDNEPTAALYYGVGLTAPIVFWFARWSWGISRGLYDRGLTQHYVRFATLRYGLATGVGLIGVAMLALDHPRLGMAAVAIAIGSFLPTPREFFASEREGKGPSH